MQSGAITINNEWLGLIFFLTVCFGVAGLGSFATTPEIPGWYAQLRKPDWTPPNWLFGPVWSAIYAAMAVAAWMVWKRTGWETGRGVMLVFAAQLALNLAWSFIFFKFHSPAWALGEVVLLWVAIAVTIVKFAPISGVAALLLAPYLVWVTYAAALNLAIWKLN